MDLLKCASKQTHILCVTCSERHTHKRKLLFWSSHIILHANEIHTCIVSFSSRWKHNIFPFKIQFVSELRRILMLTKNKNQCFVSAEMHIHRPINVGFYEWKKNRTVENYIFTNNIRATYADTEWIFQLICCQTAMRERQMEIYRIGALYVKSWIQSSRLMDFAIKYNCLVCLKRIWLKMIIISWQQHQLDLQCRAIIETQ